jgi:hypothetical protein
VCVWVCERRLTHTRVASATAAALSPSRRAPRVPPVDLARMQAGLRPHPNNANAYLSPKLYPAEPHPMYYEPPTARTTASGSMSERPTAAALLSERSMLPRARRSGGGRGSARGSSSARSFKAPTVYKYTHRRCRSLLLRRARRVCVGPSVRCRFRRFRCTAADVSASAHPPVIFRR